MAIVATTIYITVCFVNCDWILHVSKDASDAILHAITDR